MIDIKQLGLLTMCPCGRGRVLQVDVAKDTFSCWNGRGLSASSVTGHFPMPTSGPGYYTNLTNVSVTPARVRVRVSSTVSPPIAKVTAKFPHVCPKCGGACWNGFTNFEHAATGDARCP